MRSTTIGIELPDDFPVADYDAINGRLAPFKDTHSGHWGEYAAGWNGLGRRFRAAADDSDAFTTSVSAPGGGMPDHEERQMQETALYGFFVGGLSALENTAWAVHWLGATVRPTDFPVATDADKRRVKIESVEGKLAAGFSGDPIAVAFTALVNDPAYEEWKDIRNILTHRATPGRSAFETLSDTVGAGGPAPATAPPAAPTGHVDWNVGVRIDDQTTASRRVWLARVVADLVAGVDRLAIDHLEPVI